MSTLSNTQLQIIKSTYQLLLNVKSIKKCLTILAFPGVWLCYMLQVITPATAVNKIRNEVHLYFFRKTKQKNIYTLRGIGKASNGAPLKHLLADDKMKEIILSSLQFVNEGRKLFSVFVSSCVSGSMAYATCCR